MIALVHHRFFNLRDTARQHQIGFCQAQGHRPALRVRFIRKGDRRRHNGLALQVHRVLGFVGQMRAPVFHLGNPAVPIRRAFPLRIGDFLVLAPPIQPAQVFFGRVLDPFGLGQTAQVFLPVLAGVFAHDALHRRVGLQGGGVHGHRLAPQHPFLFQ